MTYRISWLLIILFAFTAQTFADQIVLKNGDRLTGTIVKSDGKRSCSRVISPAK